MTVSGAGRQSWVTSVVAARNGSGRLWGLSPGGFRRRRHTGAPDSGTHAAQLPPGNSCLNVAGDPARRAEE